MGKAGEKEVRICPVPSSSILSSFVLRCPLCLSPQWLWRRFSALENRIHPPPTLSKTEELERDLEIEMELEPEPELEQEPQPEQEPQSEPEPRQQ